MKAVQSFKTSLSGLYRLGLSENRTYLYEFLHILLCESPVHVKLIPGVQNDRFDLDTRVNAGADSFIKVTLPESQSLTMKAMSVSDRLCPLLKHVCAISRMMVLITPSA